MQSTANRNSDHSAAFEKPLSGKRIVVTRARAQAMDFVQRLEQLGAEVVELPTIEICRPESFAGLDAAVEKIESYDWLILTSVNGVEPFLSRLHAAGKSVACLGHLKIGAIGPQTARQLEAAGLRNVLVPSRYQAEGILDLFDPQEMRGKLVLIPRAAKARDVLPETLRHWGASVDVVEAYRTVAPAGDFSVAKDLLRQGKIDLISFTSSSTVRHFFQLFEGAYLGEILGETIVACIGPITAKTVEELGGRPSIVASRFTMDGLIGAIVAYYRNDVAGAGNPGSSTTS
jgi:uroporphyrinogen III methyltransferase/synthase